MIEPPFIPEHIVRLVYSDIGLPELFTRSAVAAGMEARLVHPEALLQAVQEHLRATGVSAVVIRPSKMLSRTGLATALTKAGVAMVDHPAPGVVVITACSLAIAETGSIILDTAVAAALPDHSIVVIEPKVIVPDLLDALEQADALPTDSVMLTGRGPMALVLH